MFVGQILLSLILLLGPHANATKARLSAQNNAAHIDSDEQNLFADATAINRVGPFLSFETGISTASSTSTPYSNAEAILSYKINTNQTMALSVGHQDSFVQTSRAFINNLGSTYLLHQNPVHLFWGTKGETLYGVGVFGSRYQDQVADIQESSVGLNLGTELGPWRFYGSYVFENYVKNSADEFKGAGAFASNIHYMGDNNRYYLNFFRTPAKSYNAGVEDESHDYQKLTLGLVDTTERSGNTYFWSAEVVSVRVDCQTLSGVGCSNIYSSTTLPVTLGAEARASALFTLRGSLSQTLLINQTKDEIGYPAATGLTDANGATTDYASGTNTTRMAAGVGVNFNKIVIDGLLSTATTQILNTSSLLTQVAFKYSY